jgi:hypothetical protein
MNMTAQTEAPSERKFVNKKTIAQRYGVSERTIQEWMEKKSLVHPRLHREN